MAGVTPLHLFLHLLIGSRPEGGEIGGDLQRPLGRGEQLHHQGHPAIGHAGGGALPEHLLNAHRDHRGLPRLIADPHPAAGRRAEVARQRLVQPFWQGPGQGLAQQIGEVEPLELLQPGHAAQGRQEPLLQPGQQTLVVHGGPALVRQPVAGAAQSGQQAFTALVPGQHVQPLATNALQQAAPLLFVGEIRQRPLAKHQFADHLLALGPHPLLALVPVEPLALADQLRQLAHQLVQRHRLGDEDAAAAIVLPHLDGDQGPLSLTWVTFYQIAADPTTELIAAAAAQLADPVRPGEGAQQPQPLPLGAGRAGPQAFEPTGGPLTQGPLAAMEEHGEALRSSQIFFQQRHQECRIGDNPCQTLGLQLPGPQQHARQTGMSAEGGHGAAGRSELLLSLRLHGAKGHQQATGTRHRSSGGHVQQRQALHPGAPLGGVQQQAGQLLGEDVRRALLGEALLHLGAPQPVADPGAETAGTARPLGGGGPGNLTGLQPGDAASQIEGGTPLQPAVDDHRDPLYGEGGLRHIGGEHQLAAPRRGGLYGRLLGRHVEATVEGGKAHVIRQAPLQPLGEPFYFPLSRQEHQGTAPVGRQRLQHHGAHLGLQPLLAIGGAVVVVDGKAAPLGADHRGVRQQGLQRHALQGGGHNEQLEILPQPLLALDGEGQGGIGMQAALVEFIENDERHPGKLRVLLQHPGQHPLGHYLEPGRGTGATLAPHPQPDALTHLLPKLARQKACYVARREAAGLQHDDAAGQPVSAHQLQGQQGRLARPRGGLQYHAGVAVDGIKQLGQHRDDGELGQNGEDLL
ncbi:hypothetical protein D3C72_928270 [compost metagenome]